MLRLIVMISALGFIQIRDPSGKVQWLCHRLLLRMPLIFSLYLNYYTKHVSIWMNIHPCMGIFKIEYGAVVLCKIAAVQSQIAESDGAEGQASKNKLSGGFWGQWLIVHFERSCLGVTFGSEERDPNLLMIPYRVPGNWPQKVRKAAFRELCFPSVTLFQTPSLSRSCLQG